MAVLKIYIIMCYITPRKTLMGYTRNCAKLLHLADVKWGQFVEGINIPSATGTLKITF